MALGQIVPIDVPEPPENGGTVTGLSWQRKNSDRCSVHLDGAFAFGLHADIIASEGLHKGLSLSRTDCERMLAEDRYHRIMKRIMHFVGYRPRSERELTDRLRQLGADEVLVARVTSRLADWSLVDDHSFARQFAASRLRRFGPRRVRVDLIRKGISPRLADEVLDELVDAEVLDKQLDDLAAQALKRYKRESDDRIREQKTIRYLMRRGYDADAIRRALNRIR